MRQQPICNPGLWELAVLSLLRERPMHPYEIQRLLKERHKDEVLVLKRGSLYHAIKRLEDARLIEAVETTRDGRRPERTTYRITGAGERALIEWLRTLIAVPRRERSEFMGAVSFLVHLTPEEAAAGLLRRAELLEKEVAALDAAIAELVPRISRIHVIESEYARAMRAAELEWVREVVEELRSGRLTWDFEAMLQYLRLAVPEGEARKETER
jgi:DNA-binding PadR family transcriptional regulator